MRGAPGMRFLRWPSMSAAARALGIPRGSLRRYALGLTEPPPAARARLLAEGWTPDPATRPRRSAVPPWLESYGRTPLYERCWKLPSADELARAKRRPRGCSEARWRMELRRRARGGMADAPDPRDLR